MSVFYSKTFWINMIAIVWHYIYACQTTWQLRMDRWMDGQSFNIFISLVVAGIIWVFNITWILWEITLLSFNSLNKCETWDTIILIVQARKQKFIKVYLTYLRSSVSKGQKQITKSEHFVAGCLRLYPLQSALHEDFT